jgi:hypothetical protein
MRHASSRGFMVAAVIVSGRTRIRFSLFSPDFSLFRYCESVLHVV